MINLIKRTQIDKNNTITYQTYVNSLFYQSKP